MAIFEWWCHPFQDALSQHGKVGCQNWHGNTSAYSAAGGEHDQHTLLSLMTIFRVILKGAWQHFYYLSESEFLQSSLFWAVLHHANTYISIAYSRDVFKLQIQAFQTQLELKIKLFLGLFMYILSHEKLTFLA